MLGENMPPDPFRAAAETPDLAAFAANCYVMYTACIGAGFTEAQALRFVVELMASFARNAPEQAKTGDS